MFESLLFFGILIFIILFDQYTKVSAMAYFQNMSDSLELLPFLNIVEAYNYGMSFGILSTYQHYSNIFFVILSSVISIACIVFFINNITRLHACCFGLIVGGAIGNLIDRIRIGAVFDFIDFHAFGWHYPAFNIADSAIVCGAILLLIAQFEFFNKQ